MIFTFQGEMKNQGKESALPIPLTFIFDLVGEPGQSSHVTQSKP